ncbi:MAG: tetraacyldisaccharide 4'-kinase [Candidatus Kapabacteria bacterium]|nr:tetraacyldisaccharide 4'-kinase [Candidatus Kapabacteria bacterium]
MLGTLSKLYGAVVARRNAQFDKHRRPIVEVEVPVVSVGNILAGGTGKTPVVQMIVRMLQAQGRHPAIVMRGYRRRSKGLLVVHDGISVIASVSDAGDEAFLHATSLGVPVVVSSDKVEAAAHAAGTLPCDVIVVDDGYQHRALHRDCDIVLVDRATINGTLLPRGRLREPLSGLCRADVVLCMGDVQEHEVQSFVAPDALVLPCNMRAEIPQSIRDANITLAPNSKVVAFCGIANPRRFVNGLAKTGFEVASSRMFPDHHRYSHAEYRDLCGIARKENASLVTTEKDLVKIREFIPLTNDDSRLYVVPLKVVVDDNRLAELLTQRTSQ